MRQHQRFHACEAAVLHRVILLSPAQLCMPIRAQQRTAHTVEAAGADTRRCSRCRCLRMRLPVTLRWPWTNCACNGVRSAALVPLHLAEPHRGAVVARVLRLASLVSARKAMAVMMMLMLRMTRGLSSQRSEGLRVAAVAARLRSPRRGRHTSCSRELAHQGLLHLALLVALVVAGAPYLLHLLCLLQTCMMSATASPRLEATTQ